MDKESELSPVVQPSRGQTSRGNPAAQNQIQTPLKTIEELQRGVPSKHGYSNSCQPRGPTKANYPPSETSKCDQQEKDKNNVPRFLDVPRRALRGTRSVPNSANKALRSKQSQSDPITFEVKMSEFPELGFVTPGRPALPAQQKPTTCWGPALSSSTPVVPQSVTAVKTPPARNGPQNDFRQNGSKTVVCSEQQTDAVAPTNSFGTTGSSWANVASRPPKNPTLKENTNTPEEEIFVLSSEQGTSEKKKRKKNKKKSKSPDEETYPDESEDLVNQEPPKLEDEEEFPDLAVVLAVPLRVFTHMNTAKLSIKEGNNELSGTKMGNQKDQPSARKTVPTETTKKNQKPDKASGKKSKVPVQLDIGNMLAVLEKKQQSQKSKQDARPVMLSVGGALPVGHKQPPVQKKLPWQHDKIAHNPLDSTSPLVKKGKQREVPKAKKPTPLKRVILKEREERKHNRLLEERGIVLQEFKPDHDTGTEDPSETIDVYQDEQESSNGRSSPTVSEVPEDERSVFCELSEAEGEHEEDAENDPEEASRHLSIEPKPCPPLNRPKIHSRKFRDYCSQVLSKDVDECVSNLLRELVRFQDRLYQKDPMKARMKRRLVMGLREVLKHLKLKKVKCVVISPNCERIQSKGGLDEAVHNIIDTCREQGVPFVFALSRKALGRCVNKAVPVSLVGIFNYDGAQDHYHKMIELSSEARRAYEVMVENLELSGQAEVEQENSSEPLGSEPAPPSSDCTEPEEPDHVKLWKKMLEKECNHKFLNFEILGSVPLANDCNDQTTEVEKR